jgi:hypothetical protein
LSRALDQRRTAAVIRFCRRARAHAGRGERAEALSCFLEAWELLPEPKEAWDASAFVLAGVGDLLRAGADPFCEHPGRRRGRAAPHAA